MIKILFQLSYFHRNFPYKFQWALQCQSMAAQHLNMSMAHLAMSCDQDDIIDNCIAVHVVHRDIRMSDTRTHFQFHTPICTPLLKSLEVLCRYNNEVQHIERLYPQKLQNVAIESRDCTCTQQTTWGRDSQNSRHLEHRQAEHIVPLYDDQHR